MLSFVRRLVQRCVLGTWLGLYVRWHQEAAARGVSISQVSEQEIETFVNDVVSFLVAHPGLADLVVHVLPGVMLAYGWWRAMDYWPVVRRWWTLSTPGEKAATVGLVGAVAVVEVQTSAVSSMRAVGVRR